jgi:hypothetical protein
MDDLKRKRIRRLTYLVAAVFFAGVVFFVLRGPYISNALKRIIQPELEAATGRKVITQKIFINLFPLFAEARDLKVFDEKGERLLAVRRAKAYIDLSGLFSRNIAIRRLVIREPQLTTDRKQAQEIVEHVKSYLAAPRETALKVKVLVIEVQKGNARLEDVDNKAVSEVAGLDAEVILGVSPRIRASAKKIGIKKEGWPDIGGEAELDSSVKNGAVLVRKFSVRSLGSRITGDGEYSGGGGNFEYDARILFTSVKKMFHLERSGQGQLSAEGTVAYRNGDMSVDMKVKGNFFIQTLMELLKVREQVEGLVKVNGGIKGPLKNVKGYGALSLQRGNLFGVEVESLKCKVSYADGKMDFTEGSGTLYHGTARLSASLDLPVVDSYTVQADFEDVDSKPVFRLIGWDPGIQPGKVSGGLKTSGAEFNPEGRFSFRSVSAGKDVLGRVSYVSGGFRKQGNIISLADLKLETARSEIYAKGTADIEKKELDMDVLLKTRDLPDLTMPYYDKLKGRGAFSGSVRGAFEDPVISGALKITDPFFEGYKAEMMKADVSYRKKVLEIRDMSAKGGGGTARAKGDVYFRNARELFDITGAVYKVDASMKDADLERFARIFYPEFRGTGRLGGRVKVRGSEDDPIVSGDGRVDNAVIYGVPFDQATFGWSYAGKRLNFDKMQIVRGKSVFFADAALEASGSFFYEASADTILLSDIVRRKIRGEAVFSLKSKGHGTFDNPEVSLTAKMKEGRLRERPISGGVIAASVKDKNITFSATMIEDKVRITGRGRLEKEIPWEAEVDVQTGRYDSIISALLKDVPEDLLLSLHGKVFLHGDREHIFASSTINQVTLSMYGYTFTNEEEIKFDLRDRQITLNKVMMRSGNTSLRIEGNLELGKEYNLVVEGNSSLAPLKSLSTKIGFLRGDGEFVLAVTGNWDTPEINGGVTVTNGAIALKDYPYRLSSLNGYLYMDNDRIILQKLSGKIGGGEVDLSGVVYLKKFSVKRYYIEAGLSNVTASFSSDFTVNFGGNLLLKGDPESRLISGDIKINRARYRERIEWKSWLLKTRKTEAFKGEISGLEKTELNIRVTGKENIRIDNNVARADALVELILRGTVSHPVLFGRTEFAGGGAVYFRNNEFRILHASADFTDPNRINPYISISADTVVKGYKIKMNLEGHLDHFNMSLSSDPVLKEMDVLSLLTVGQTGGELKGLEGGIGASEATSFVTGKLQDVIEERLRSVTGLDRFQIDPHVSKITGTVEPRVTVSKRLLGDKVFVTFTSAVGSTEEQIIKLEYFLSRSVSLVGVRDERGILGGDVRFRFEFK